MNRRDFVSTSLLATSGAVLSLGKLTMSDDSQPATGSIDAHSHIWTRDIEQYPLANGNTLDDLAPASFTAEELIATAKQVGVTRVVLIQHRPYHGTDNSYITDTMARFPGVFSAVACIDEMADNTTAEMDRLQLLGVRGFRIRPGEGGTADWNDSPQINAMWTHAAESDVAICPLINPADLPMVERMCEQHPETMVVIDHFARIGIDGEIRVSDLNNLCQLARHKKTHVKTSAFYALGKKQPPHTELEPMIRRLCDEFGPERLMWASDAPYQLVGVNTYADSIALIRDRCDWLSDSDRQWLLKKTAERMFFT